MSRIGAVADGARLRRILDQGPLQNISTVYGQRVGLMTRAVAHQADQARLTSLLPLPTALALDPRPPGGICSSI
jgi:hypothetical protein